MPTTPLLTTSLSLPVRSGKVRDVYDLGEHLLIVSTDRISAFDWILPNGIPDKGMVLTQLSKFWFDYLETPHHLVSTELPSQLTLSSSERDALEGRSMVVKKAEVIPFECVVRGYLEGSAWREYQNTGSVCGIELPAGLRQCDQLPSPIFTPATKAESGHDENVSFEFMASQLGDELANELLQQSLDVYEKGCLWARERGILIADTKFEWGKYQDQILLIDEVLTPDSSRFWPADQYAPGAAQPSFDKQFVREWLDESGWDKESEPPALPEQVVTQTRAKYVEAFERLTESTFGH